MYNLIKKAEPKWPDPEKHGISVSQEAKDLILKLLIKDRKGRLGQQGDVDEVLAHPFFSGINLEALLSKQIKADFIPIIDSTGLNNFDQFLTDQKPEESMIPQENLAMIMECQEEFKDFSYNNEEGK